VEYFLNDMHGTKYTESDCHSVTTVCFFWDWVTLTLSGLHIDISLVYYLSSLLGLPHLRYGLGEEYFFGK